MVNLNTFQAQASATENDADVALSDSSGDSPSRLSHYRLLLEQLHRYVTGYVDLKFTPLLNPAFRAVPISVSADAIQLKWGDWASIISYLITNKSSFLRSQ